MNARQARIVECRFYGGMSIEETAEALSVSPATVKREWTLARALAQPGAAIVTDARTEREPMSTDRWQRVQEVFAAAIECEETARAHVLGDQCGDDEGCDVRSSRCSSHTSVRGPSTVWRRRSHPRRPGRERR